MARLGYLLLGWTTTLIDIVVVKLLVRWSTILAIRDHLVCYGLPIDRNRVAVHVNAWVNLTARHISDESLVLRGACHWVCVRFTSNLAIRWQSMVQLRNVYWVFTTELLSLVVWLIGVIVGWGLGFVASSDLAKFTLTVDVSVALEWGRPRHFKL